MATEYHSDGHLLRLEDGVLEQFSRAVAGSHRVPLAWMGVRLEQRKHDVVRVEIGTAADPQAELFSGVAFSSPAFTFEIPASEEAALRAFLAAAARSAGRTT